MGIFNSSKNNSVEFSSLENFNIALEELLKEQKFISRKDYLKIVNDVSKIVDQLTVMENQKILAEWAKKQKVN